jgi:hypothetical protein
MDQPDGHKDKSTAEIEKSLRYLQIKFTRSIRDPKFVLEVITLIVFVIYAIYTGRMYYANRDAANAAKSGADTAARQLEMADRPWIKDTVRSNFDFTWDKGGVSWAVVIRADNVGHSVATAIYPQAELIAIEGADVIDGPRRKARELCDEVSNRFEKVKSDPVVWSNGGWPTLSRQVPRGCPTLPALFAGGWAFRAAYNLQECTSNQSGGWPTLSPSNSQSGVAPPFPRFLREGGPSVRLTICMNAHQTSPLSGPALPAFHHVQLLSSLAAA